MSGSRLNSARAVSSSKISLCVYARVSVVRSAPLNLSTISKWDESHPPVCSGLQPVQLQFGFELHIVFVAEKAS